MKNHYIDSDPPYDERPRIIFDAMVDALKLRIFNCDTDETDLLFSGTRGFLVIFDEGKVIVDHIDEEPPVDYSSMYRVDEY